MHQLLIALQSWCNCIFSCIYTNMEPRLFVLVATTANFEPHTALFHPSLTPSILSALNSSSLYSIWCTNLHNVCLSCTKVHHCFFRGCDYRRLLHNCPAFKCSNVLRVPCNSMQNSAPLQKIQCISEIKKCTLSVCTFHLTPRAGKW